MSGVTIDASGKYEFTERPMRYNECPYCGNATRPNGECSWCSQSLEDPSPHAPSGFDRLATVVIGVLIVSITVFCLFVDC